MNISKESESDFAKRKTKKNEEERFEQKLTLRCDWVNCYFTTSDAENFISHVEQHEPHYEPKDSVEKGTGNFHCMWEACGFASQNKKLVSYHINYHGFHTKLKAFGSVILDKQKNNFDCHLDYSSRNILPDLPSERVCEWRCCHFRTTSYQRLLEHANKHVTGRPRRQNNQTVLCEWGDCEKINKDMTKLKSHLRSHTQEKSVACPVCGAQFASNTKFIDHCARQTAPENKLCVCSYCKKRFASERLLQDHIRLHVNLHKCPMCDMTCPFRSTLVMHIRHRHLGDRPFKCTFCDHAAITERGLKTHYQTHCSENVWVCEENDCDFSCRSKNGLNSHYAKVHRKSADVYGCHICNATYDRGSCLTVHLKTKHFYRWASGQSRFRYIKDNSGIFRLQTVRYESIEVTEQIMANTTGRRQQPKKFVCVIEAPNKIVISEDHATTDETDEGDSQSDTDPDDPEDMDDLETASEALNEATSELDETEPSIGDKREDVDSDFGESLKRHLGIQEGFIEIIK